jgi:hypothetical protein
MVDMRFSNVYCVLGIIVGNDVMRTHKICIDPGVHYLGWAMGSGVLTSCGYKQLSNYRSLDQSIKLARTFVEHLLQCIPHNEVKHLIIEQPVFRRGSNINHQNIQNLMDIAEACSVMENTVLVDPMKWKGSVPKVPHQKRIMKTLTPEEISVYNQCRTGVAKNDHNIVDAIGIFLWSERRLKR